MKGDRHRLNPWTTLGLGGFLVVVFGPLLSLMASVIVELSQGNGAWLSLLVPTGRRWQLLGNSLQLAIAVGTVSTVLGGLIACYLWQTAWAWRWRWGLLPLLFVPSYIHSFGWSALGLGLNGGLRSLGFGTIPLQGWWSCDWGGCFLKGMEVFKGF